MDAESLISFGAFICFMTFLLAGSIYAEARITGEIEKMII